VGEGESRIDVVDCQVHLNLLGSVDSGVAAMDAVGVSGVVIDEWWGFDADGLRVPHYRLDNGAVRHLRRGSIATTQTCLP
jgi:L-fuconolactonase